jgi:hypothetical protein
MKKTLKKPQVLANANVVAYNNESCGNGNCWC